ncbi:MAG: DUF371 domain-containing protein [Sulfolobales archaeon]
MEYCVDVVTFEGHVNVRATHPTSLEVTRDDYLTPRGDCIIGIKSSKGASDLRQCLKDDLKRGGTLLGIIVTNSGLFDYFVAEGSERLTLKNARKLIVRKSHYVDDSTIGLRSNKSSRDLDRALVEALKRGEKGYLVLVTSRSKISQELSTLPIFPLELH